MFMRKKFLSTKPTNFLNTICLFFFFKHYLKFNAIYAICILLPYSTICRLEEVGCKEVFCPEQDLGSTAHYCAGGGSLTVYQPGC